MQTTNGIKIEYVAIDKLKPAKYNPRKIREEELEKLKSNIKEFGMVDPIVVNSDLTIIGGHQRYKACVSLFFREMPVVKVDLDKEQEKILNVSLNKIKGEWDERKLAETLSQIKHKYGMTGFSKPEVKKLLKKYSIDSRFLEGKEEEPFDAEEEAAKITEPRTKPGDLYQLDNHRLLCGDATRKEDIEKLMDGKQAKLCFTSPPYNMAGEMYRNYTDNLKSQEYIDFNLNIIHNIKYVLKGFLFWNISYNKNARWEWIEIFYRIIKETGFTFLENIIWDKGHGIPITSKKGMTRQIENILVVGSEADVGEDLEINFVGANVKDYWFNKKTMKGLTNYWRIGTNKTQIKEHKACFPVALPVKAILLMTQLMDIVIDACLGSGTTLIGCERTGRICYGMDNSPVYCDVIVARWEKYTGKKAVVLQGQSMN